MSTATQKPRYAQLAQQLREMIGSGELQVGDRLPSYNEMYRLFGAAPATVQRVCDILEKEQLIERRSGSGVYVAPPPQKPRTGNIGFIGGTSYNAPHLPFYQLLMGGVQQAVRAGQKHLLYLGNEHDWEVEACEKVDGIVLCNIEDAQSIVHKLPPHLPCVSILTIVEDIVSVGIDDYRGAQLAMRYLLGQGHQRIACLMEKSPSESRRRFNGYRDALLEVGIEPEASWIRLADATKMEDLRQVFPQPYREWGVQQMSQWLQEGWGESGCTALLVQNEVAAIGAMQMLQKEGIEVPGQVSVVGFDGTQLCELASPSLCAVELPLVEIGVKAVELLQQQIEGETPAGQAVMLPLSMRPGDSVSQLNSSDGVEAKLLIECA
jgi:DNA-binding LacI/PurR family transcriptional regulator